jgi:hypothetical protein
MFNQVFNMWRFKATLLIKAVAKYSKVLQVG